MPQTPPERRRRAVVLLSGGLDSATTAAIARRDGYALYALSIRYGQRHVLEIAAADRVAAALGTTAHVVQTIDLRAFGGSALTDDIDVPKSDAAADIGAGIPVTYVPARNTVFLAVALAYAEVIASTDIFIGVNAVDYAGYPDCRPEFIAAFERVANLATRAGVEGRHITIHAPLLSMAKADIIRKGADLGVDFALTWSCYDPVDDTTACGRCDSCHLRRDGFAAARIVDPLPYAT
ncbi:MAG: 7-cyano-7-deazaguanine synthase QueC [Phycisphaerae bacterium]